MTCQEDKRKHRRNAQTDRDRGALIEAGDDYSMAAHAYFAMMTPAKSSGVGLRYLLHAATCYRVAGQLDRCQNRCRMGILRATEIRNETTGKQPPEYGPHHAEWGGWDESIGDFRIIGELNGVDTAYQAANHIYREAGDPEAYWLETPHDFLNAYFFEVAAAVGVDVDEWTELHTDSSATEWSDYKREHLPEFIGKLVEHGAWPVPEPKGDVS